MYTTKYIKTLITGVAVIMATCPQAWAVCPNGQIEDTTTGPCLKTGSDCNGKCTWYYDTQTQDLVIKPNPDAYGDLTVKNTYGHSYGGTYIKAAIKNVTIAEGITGLDVAAMNNWTNPFDNDSTLKLPTTLKNINTLPSTDLPFKTVELSTGNLETIGAMNLRSIQTLILTPSEGKKLPSSFFGRRTTNGRDYGITIVCNGDIELCKRTVAAAKATEERNGITFTYEQHDAKGNVIAKYDSNGDLTAAYAYNADGSIEIYDGNRRLVGLKNARSITPAQAAALIRKGNNNKVTLTFK